MKSVKDISFSIKYKNYTTSICNHYCNNKTKKCNFYDWFTYLDNKFIKSMCETCALREAWGYNYKQKKGYKLWSA